MLSNTKLSAVIQQLQKIYAEKGDLTVAGDSIHDEDLVSPHIEVDTIKNLMGEDQENPGEEIVHIYFN